MKNQYWWGGGASEEAYQQIPASTDLQQIGVLTFGPVQAFLGGGERLRDWAVASWLCHYLTAVLIHRWKERGGIVLFPLHSTTPLLDWLEGGNGTINEEGFWRSELPNVLVGLIPDKEGWLTGIKKLLTQEWGRLLQKLESAAVQHSPKLLDGIGWRVIHANNQHLWSVYAQCAPLRPEFVSEDIGTLFAQIESQKIGRQWTGSWWGGRTSPTAGSLSIWNPGLIPFDDGGTWGLPDEQLEKWWERAATESRLSGLFSSDERLNSIEMVKRIASVPEIIEPTLKALWGNQPPNCPWRRFPDRSAVAAAWVPTQVEPDIWRKGLQDCHEYYFDHSSKTEIPWGMPALEGTTYTHPRILERRSVRDAYEGKAAGLSDYLKEWEANIPKGWESTIEWTVGWRGDGDNFGKWLSGEQFRALHKKLPWAKWHPTPEIIAEYQLNAAMHPIKGARVIELPHMLDLAVLFKRWNHLLYPLTEKQHQGKVIFAGGDDFLLIGPLPEVVPLTTDLHRLWSGKKTDLTKPLDPAVDGWVNYDEQIYPIPGQLINFSLGVVIAQRRIPQSQWHRGLTQAYKKAKLQGKNRVCLQVIFNSGQTLEWVCPWPLWELLMTAEADFDEKTDLNRWEKLLAYIEGSHLQKITPGRAQAMLDTLWQGLGFSLRWAQVEALAALEFDKEIQNWQWWLQWISLRTFLARQDRERLTWLQSLQEGGL